MLIAQASRLVHLCSDGLNAAAIGSPWSPCFAAYPWHLLQHTAVSIQYVRPSADTDHSSPAAQHAVLQAREQYRPAAAAASTFYFVVANLALISPMYQTSLSSMISMFDHCIDSSEKAADVGIRLRLLTTFATHFMFDKVQRGLFEQHKLLFSFMLATARAAGQVTEVRS